MKQANFKIIGLIFIFNIIFYSNFFGQVINSVKAPIGINFVNKYDPAINNSGDEMVFSSDKSGKFKIYYTKKKSDSFWSEPVEIEIINSFNGGLGNIRYPSFNYDASKLYFSADFNKDSSDVDIFYSERIGDNWTEPKSIGTPINSKAYEGQPSISIDDKSLYFVRNNSEIGIDGYECKSIFLSVRDKSGNWENPIKLPVPINVGCEQTPKISIDNKTLYFSSYREGGKGGFDIYKTKLIAKNVWLPAESIDTLNTEFNDFCPGTFFNSDKTLYSIEQSDKKTVNSNIYEMDMPRQFLPGTVLQLKGFVRDLTSKKPLSANIFVYDPYTSRQLYSLNNFDENGEFEIYLPRGNEYQIDFQKENYSHYFLNVDTKEIRKNEQQVTNVSLYRNISLLLNIIDKEIYKPIESIIEVSGVDSIPIKTQIDKEKIGLYRIILPIGEKYRISIKADYYDSEYFDFDLTKIVQFDEFERDIELNAKKVEFEINISDEETNLGLPVEVIITNLENNEVIKTVATPDSEGKYIIHLRDGDKYNVSVSPKGYSFYNTTVDLKKKKKQNQKLEVKLKQLKEDTKLTLNNITFEVNSDDLNSESFSELDRVVKLMNDNPDIKIEISAHTDNSGSDVYNLRLSKRRANTVVEYMLEKNINSSRLISKGHGETKPLYPNDTDENKALNRRVELKIIKS
ncbi:MAG: OmpA family protein [Bacteroidales bacterium]|nr:OmpA family protein [Bacteroidales bacterium]MBN2757628.1 OmpA family protein [Bacteroidales bacterium]